MIFQFQSDKENTDTLSKLLQRTYIQTHERSGDKFITVFINKGQHAQPVGQGY